MNIAFNSLLNTHTHTQLSLSTAILIGQHIRSDFWGWGLWPPMEAGRKLAAKRGGGARSHDRLVEGHPKLSARREIDVIVIIMIITIIIIIITTIITTYFYYYCVLLLVEHS